MKKHISGPQILWSIFHVPLCKEFHVPCESPPSPTSLYPSHYTKIIRLQVVRHIINLFYSKECSLIFSYSLIPTDFGYVTDKHSLAVRFSIDKITEITNY